MPPHYADSDDAHG